MIRALGVGAFLVQVKARLQKDFRSQWIRGEVSQVSVSAQGHLYFQLKDRGGVLSAVVWASRRADLDFQPRDGIQVVAWGSLTVYPNRGHLQFTVDQMMADGVGQYFEALEKLKQQLLTEGLFAVARKRPLPFLPQRIGVVTSQEGAVWHDIRTTLERRNPCVQILLSAAVVQGAQAVPSLLRALDRLLEHQVEVVIVARGGGSWEDLMAFNHERLVRYLASYPVPVLSAIGHETDHSLVDQVADRRAPTPTAAAEMVAPELRVLRHQLNEQQVRMRNALVRRLQRERQQWQALSQRAVLQRPEGWTQPARNSLEQLTQRLQQYLQRPRQQLHQWSNRLQARHLLSLLSRQQAEQKSLEQRLQAAMNRRFENATSLLAQQSALLKSLSPKRVMQRGYALCLDEQGRPLQSVRGRKAQDRLEICLADGSLDCRVERIIL